MYEEWKPRKKKYQGARRRQTPMERRLWIRSCQFWMSLWIFLFVFLGQGVYPHKFNQTSQLISQHFQGEISWKEAFENLGTALAQEEFELQDLEHFCREVLGKSSFSEEIVEVSTNFQEEEPVLFLPSNHYFNLLTPYDFFEKEAEMVMAPQEKGENMPIGTVISSENGEDLSWEYCFDHLYLGEREMVSPIYTWVTSGFGGRINPYSEEWAVHKGVDLWASTGTEIVAWSAGKVVEVGESEAMGLYIKLFHGDDIHSLYAHCSEILVQENQVVLAGEPIGKVGATGQVTGAHLHFELTWGAYYLNPLHYFAYETT